MNLCQFAYVTISGSQQAFVLKFMDIQKVSQVYYFHKTHHKRNEIYFPVKHNDVPTAWEADSMQIKTTFVVNIPNTIGATAEEEWDNGWMGESSGSGGNPLILVLVLVLVLLFFPSF